MNETHIHQYDPISGWCTYAAPGDSAFCGHRNDGRQIMPYSGEILRTGPNYTREALQAIAAKVKTLIVAKYPRYTRASKDEAQPAFEEPGAA